MGTGRRGQNSENAIGNNEATEGSIYTSELPAGRSQDLRRTRQHRPCPGGSRQGCHSRLLLPLQPLRGGCRDIARQRCHCHGCQSGKCRISFGNMRRALRMLLSIGNNEATEGSIYTSELPARSTGTLWPARFSYSSRIFYLCVNSAGTMKEIDIVTPVVAKTYEELDVGEAVGSPSGPTAATAMRSKRASG